MFKHLPTQPRRGLRDSSPVPMAVRSHLKKLYSKSLRPSESQQCLCNLITQHRATKTPGHTVSKSGRLVSYMTQIGLKHRECGPYEVNNLQLVHTSPLVLYYNTGQQIVICLIIRILRTRNDFRNIIVDIEPVPDLGYSQQ